MIHRAEHNDNYTIIANDAIRSGLSDGAKVLLFYMLSCSDDWAFNVKGLAHTLNLSEFAIKIRLKELRENGFLKLKKVQNKKGHFGEYEWEVFEVPNVRGIKNPTSVKTDGRKSPTSVKTEGGKTNPIRNNNIKEIPISKEITKSIYGEFSHVLLSDAEYEKLTSKLGESDRDSYIDRLDRYIENYPSKGKKYHSHYSTILNWYDRDKKKESQPQPIRPKYGVDMDEFNRLIQDEARRRGEI